MKEAYNGLKGLGTTSSSSSSSSSNGSLTAQSGKGTVTSATTVYDAYSGGKAIGEVYNGGELKLLASQGSRIQIQYVTYKGATKTGWIEENKLKRYDKGGKIGNDGIAMVHKDEVVLTTAQTKLFERFINFEMPSMRAMFEKLNSSNLSSDSVMGEIINNNVTFNNTYNVTNNTDFDEEKFENSVEKQIRKDLYRIGKTRRI